MLIIIIIITKSHKHGSVGVMGLCIKLVDIDWLFFCVILTLVCSLRSCHRWLTRNHIFIREIWGKFTLFIYWNFSRSTWEISKFQKSELGKFISNSPLKHVITSTNLKWSRTTINKASNNSGLMYNYGCGDELIYGMVVLTI